MTEQEVLKAAKLLRTRDDMREQLKKIDASKDVHVYVHFEKVNISVSRSKIRDGVEAKLLETQAELSAMGVTADLAKLAGGV
jgi:hypothetical protein